MLAASNYPWHTRGMKLDNWEFKEVATQIIDPSVLMAQETGVIADNPPAQDMNKYLAGNIYLMEHLGVKTWLKIFLEQIENLMAKAPEAYQGVTIDHRTWITQQAKLVKKLGADVWLIETITGLVGHTPQFDRNAVWEQVERLREADQ